MSALLYQDPAAAAREAYAAWVDHGLKCDDCLTAGRADDSPCQTGQMLWDTYKTIRGIE